MAFTLQVKTGTINPLPNELLSGELGYNTSSGTLFVGNGAVAPIAVAMDGHLHSLEVLSDTVITNVTDGQALIWSDGVGWINSTIQSGGATTLDDLTNVIITGDATGQVLTFNGTNWVNQSFDTSTGDVSQADFNNHVSIQELRAAYKDAYSNHYKEIIKTLVNGLKKVTSVNIWTDSGKGTQLFSKTIGYNANTKANLVVTTDIVSGKVLTKTIAYPDADTITITEVIT